MNRSKKVAAGIIVLVVLVAGCTAAGATEPEGSAAAATTAPKSSAAAATTAPKGTMLPSEKLWAESSSKPAATAKPTPPAVEPYTMADVEAAIATGDCAVMSHAFDDIPRENLSTDEVLDAIIALDEACEDGAYAETPPPAARSPKRILEGALKVGYKELFRNSDKYEGEPVRFKGEVIQVIDGGDDSYDMRVNVTKGEYGFYEDTVYVLWQGDRVLEDDIIEFVGISNGPYTYESTMGGNVTIPLVDATVVNQSYLRVID